MPQVRRINIVESSRALTVEEKRKILSGVEFDSIMSTSKLAKLLSVSTSTLRAWGKRQYGPEYNRVYSVKYKKRVVQYTKEDVLKWLRQCGYATNA